MVVVATVTSWELPVTTPTSGSIEISSAPCTSQLSVVCPPPSGRFAGSAEKETTTGPSGACAAPPSPASPDAPALPPAAAPAIPASACDELDELPAEDEPFAPAEPDGCASSDVEQA